MKRAQRVKITTLILLLAWSSGAVSTFSLQDALDMATSSNDRMRKADARMEQMKWQKRSAVSAFLPSVTLSGGYNIMDEPLTMDLNPIKDAMVTLQSKTLTKMAVDSMVRATGGTLKQEQVKQFSDAYYQKSYEGMYKAIPSFEKEVKQKEYPTANLMVTTPLFAGGRLIAQKNAADAEERSVQSERLKSRNDLTGEVINAYLSAALMESVVKLRTEALTGIEQHADRARRMEAEGMIPHYHVIRATVAVSEATRTLQEDKNRRELAYEALSRLTGLPREEIGLLTDTLVFRELDTTRIETLIADEANQPILKMIDGKCEMAKAKVMADQGTMLPSVAAFYKLELAQEYLSSTEPAWVVGVNATVPLFSGFRNSTRYMQSRELLNEAKFTREGALKDIRLWKTRAYLQIGNAHNNYEKLATDADLAEENYRAATSRFDNGYGTSLEVIDANLVKEKVAIDRLKAVYDYHTAVAELFAAWGNTGDAVTYITGKGTLK